MVNPNWEAIMDLEPDLVVATTAGNDRNAVAQAEALQLPLFFLNTPDIGSLLESLIRLGELVGHPARARALRDALTGRLERLERRSSAGPRPRVLFLVWSEPIVVPGRRTFLDDALRRTGCESISSDGPSGWPTYDLETVLLRNPEWILAAAQNAPFLDGLKERPGWRRLEAVRRGRVAAVNPALERPAPRVIEAMEQLQELLEKGEKK
jgi:iron complex transport system substrate-binding protein